MRFCTALLILGIFSFTACDEDDTPVLVTYDPPVFLENVEFVSNTNTPEVQINRFVAANNMDTVMTSSGLVYQILDAGSTEKPTNDSEIIVWYRGYTVDGIVFDESGSRPLTTDLNRLYKAWQEGVPKLGKGGKMWMLARPSLASENNSPSNGTRILVFEIELIDFE